MSPLSSSTLFHFTPRLENLLGILTDEFLPHYSLEDYAPVFGGRIAGDAAAAIPMVCFCDMPLSQAAGHITSYGRYSIGLTKSWGMAAGVAPVLYTYPDSATTAAVIYLHLRIEELQGTVGDGAPFSPQTERLICFVKPYEGELRRDGHDPKPVRFYDEREWRFVPARGWRALTRAEFADAQVRNAANGELWPALRLSFEPADIRYIVVAEEIEIPRMIQEVRRIKTPKFSGDDIALLCSRIVSAEQIAADF